MKGTILYKMSGSGNDFVMLDARCVDPAQWTAERIAAVCQRRAGIGADGLVLLAPESAEDVRMTYWNADGSRAAMCGNAALCSARLAVYLEMVPPGELCLLTDAGAVPARAEKSGECAEIHLPDTRVPGPVPGISRIRGEQWIGLATVGVPHLVIRVEDIEAVDVPGRGRELRHAPETGPAGANVNFIAPSAAGGPWLIRTFERGVEGETLACGTGTVAAALALESRQEAGLPARFLTRGGPALDVRATVDGPCASNIWLGGQGRLVFRAIWEG